jgi:hypothetical protein
MLPPDIINAMRTAGAFEANRFDSDGNLYFDINFKVIEEQFPMYLEELALANLAPAGVDMYHLGYIAYYVLDNGELAWQPTKKLQDELKND